MSSRGHLVHGCPFCAGGCSHRDKDSSSLSCRHTLAQCKLYRLPWLRRARTEQATGDRGRRYSVDFASGE
uniref:Uncharacterized protein n=1 Tax=Triticum urartu TaxID=4572 RepID=A0A8R7QS69_TRIUA